MQLLYLDHKSCLSVRWYGIMYRNTVVKIHHTSQRYKSGNVKKDKESFDTVWIIGEWLYNFLKRLYKLAKWWFPYQISKVLQFRSGSPPPKKRPSTETCTCIMDTVMILCDYSTMPMYRNVRLDLLFAG